MIKKLASILSLFALTSCVTLQQQTGTSMIQKDSLGKWKVTDFAGHGEVTVENGVLKIGMGIELTGVNWTGELPKEDYEISFEGRRVLGNDFFCGLTFPVKDKHATLVLGGWGGALVGISSLDNLDASENETGDVYIFEDGDWYAIKLHVLSDRLKVWINGKEQINVSLENREVGMRPGEIEQSIPLGIATWITGSEIRNMRMRQLVKTE